MLTESRASTMRTLLMASVEAHFGTDEKRIEHARAVLRLAEALAPALGAELRIVVPAAILHDVGIKPAMEKYGSAAGPLQEREGPPVARPLLEELGFSSADIEEICAIIGSHHTPDAAGTAAFKAVYDADRIVNMREMADAAAPASLKREIDRTLLTEAGRALAARTYLGGRTGN